MIIDEYGLSCVFKYIQSFSFVENNNKAHILHCLEYHPLDLKQNFKLIPVKYTQQSNGTYMVKLDNESIGKLILQYEEAYRLIMQKEYKIDQDRANNALKSIVDQECDPDDFPLFKQYAKQSGWQKFVEFFKFQREPKIYENYVRVLIKNYRDLYKIYNDNGICQFGILLLQIHI